MSRRLGCAERTRVEGSGQQGSGEMAYSAVKGRRDVVGWRR
jgi:hypothetical protein